MFEPNELEEKINESLSNLSITESNTDEKDEMNEIDKLMKSKTSIIDYSTRTDPYLAALTVAARHGRDKQLRAIIENRLSDWLDENKDLCDEIKTVELDKVLMFSNSIIYERKIAELNKHIDIIKNELLKYIEYKYYCSVDETGKLIRLLDISDDLDEENYVRVTLGLLHDYIVKYFNPEVNPEYRILESSHLRPHIGDNLFPELTEIVSRSINAIGEIYGYNSSNIFLAHREFAPSDKFMIKMYVIDRYRTVNIVDFDRMDLSISRSQILRIL